MSKTSIALLLLALLGLGVAVWLRRGEEPGGPEVAYSSVGDPNPWFLAFSAELKKEADRRGYNFRVTHADAKVEKQLADVEDIVAQKPDYLILGPIDREGSAPKPRRSAWSSCTELPAVETPSACRRGFAGR